MTTTNNISRDSSHSEIIEYLTNNNLGDRAIEEFKKNEVDGEDFFELEFNEIYALIPKLKTRKAFIRLWSQVTNMRFDENNEKVEMDISEEYIPTRTPVGPRPQQPNRPSTANANKNNPSECSLHLDSDIEMDSEINLITSTPLSTSVDSRAQQRESSSPCTQATNTSTNTNNSSKRSLELDSTTSANKKGKQQISSEDSTHWLEHFVLPSRWEADVEEGLKKKMLNPSQRNSLVRQLCTSIMSKTDSCNTHERSHIALLLVQRYPFLKGSFGTGHQLWAKKIEERILNVKRKVSRNKRKELLKETGAAVEKKKPGRKSKGRKTIEVPTIPEEETLESLELHRQQLSSIVGSRTTPPDVHKIRQLMDVTFPLRRKSIIEQNERVWKVLKDYPCLQDSKSSELKAELARILNRPDLVKEIREAFEQKKTDIMNAIKKTNNKGTNSLLILLEDVDPSEQREMENRCIFAALPHALGEKQTSNHNVGKFFWQIIPDDSDHDTDKIIAECSTPQLLSIGEDYTNTQIILLIGEGMVINKFRPGNIVTAVISLLSCFYTFNCDYPKGLSKNIYLFLEHVLLNKKDHLPVGVENFLSLF